MTGLTEFELRTLPGLWRSVDHDSRWLAFRTQSPAQESLREQVAVLLGALPQEQVDPDPTLIASAEDDGFKRELIVIQTQASEAMPCYVLTPQEAAPPYKTILALHGHGTWGAKSLVGLADSAAEIEFIETYHMDFARQFARQGYLVFAPVLRAFAERMEDEQRQMQYDHPDEPWLCSCHQLSLNALLTGKTLMGLRRWDVTRLIDYLQSRPDVQPDRLACVGFSGGGTLAMYTAALDPRISCAYISGAVNTFRDSIMSIDHCLCNYIPGILKVADMGDIAGLIAPRPLLIEGGQQDPIYPVAGLEQAAALIRRVYVALGLEDHFRVHVHQGAHRWDGAPARAWLAQWL